MKTTCSPACASGSKGKITFSGQITHRIFKRTGLRITAHQFRHAAGALILQKNPGNYELVRLMLGHRDVQTTIRCYAGLKEIEAARIFGKIIRRRLSLTMDAANDAEHPKILPFSVTQHTTAVAAGERMAQFRPASLGGGLPSGRSTAAWRDGKSLRQGQSRRLCRSIRCVLGFFAAKRFF